MYILFRIYMKVEMYISSGVEIWEIHSLLMKTYFVYILKCSDGGYYTGHTNNLERRLAEHNSGNYDSYTKSRRPLRLVYSTELNERKQAFYLERKIKSWSRKKKEALIKGDFKLLHKYSECKNETHYRNKDNK